MGTSFSSHVAGAFFMLLVAFGFYYVSWSSDLGGQEKWVVSNLAALERAWQPAGGRMKVGYRAIGHEGFPFRSKIVLFSPTLKLSFPQATYVFSMSTLTFSLQDDASKEFTVTGDAGFSMQIKAENGAEATFDAYLSAKPALGLVARAPEGHKSVTGWNQYQVEMPENLSLTVSSLHRVGQVPLGSGALLSQGWKNLPAKVDSELRGLIGLVQRTPK